MNKQWFWIVLIGIHLFCFGKQFFIQTTVLQDTKEYLFAADNLLQKHILYAWDLNEPFNPNWSTKRPFLYPAILAFIKLISFGNSKIFLLITLLLQNLISLYALRIVEKIVIRLNFKFNYALAFLIIILTPAQVIYSNLIMSEIWLQLILVLMLNYLLFENNQLKKFWLLAILCILAMSLKPVMLFTAFCLPIYYFIVFKLNGSLKMALISCLPLIFFLGNSLSNEHRTGYFSYSSISNINLLQYNTYTLLIKKYDVRTADSIIDNLQFNSNSQPSYKLQQQYINNKTLQIIKDNLPLYTLLHLRGMAFCLMDPGRFDLSQFLNLQHTRNLLYEINKKDNLGNILRSFINPLGILLLFIFIMNILKIILGIRFLFYRKISLNHKLLLISIPIYILLLTGPIGSSRFALPFFPIYLIIVLIGSNFSKGTKLI